jgi:hypothetical protein
MGSKIGTGSARDQYSLHFGTNSSHLVETESVLIRCNPIRTDSRQVVQAIGRQTDFRAVARELKYRNGSCMQVLVHLHPHHCELRRPRPTTSESAVLVLLSGVRDCVRHGARRNSRHCCGPGQVWPHGETSEERCQPGADRRHRHQS